MIVAACAVRVPCDSPVEVGEGPAEIALRLIGQAAVEISDREVRCCPDGAVEGVDRAVEFALPGKVEPVRQLRGRPASNASRSRIGKRAASAEVAALIEDGAAVGGGRALRDGALGQLVELLLDRGRTWRPTVLS